MGEISEGKWSYKSGLWVVLARRSLRYQKFSYLSMTVWVSKIFSQWGVVKELYITLYYHFLKCILEDIKF